MLAFVRGNPPTPQGVDNNGTASFVEFPKGKFIVTNHHVWDHFSPLASVFLRRMVKILAQSIAGSLRQGMMSNSLSFKAVVTTVLPSFVR